MRFRLKALFLLTTLTAIAIGVTLIRIRHARMVKEHAQSFEQLAKEAGEFDTQLRELLCNHPSVQQVLAAYNSQVPENHLAGGYGSECELGEVFESPNFRISYTYHWQRPDSWEVNGAVDLVLQSELDRLDLSPHKLKVSYTDSAENVLLVDWLETQLVKEERKLQFIRQPKTASSPAP